MEHDGLTPQSNAQCALWPIILTSLFPGLYITHITEANARSSRPSRWETIHRFCPFVCPWRQSGLKAHLIDSQATIMAGGQSWFISSTHSEIIQVTDLRPEPGRDLSERTGLHRASPPGRMQINTGRIHCFDCLVGPNSPASWFFHFLCVFAGCRIRQHWSANTILLCCMATFRPRICPVSLDLQWWWQLVGFDLRCHQTVWHFQRFLKCTFSQPFCHLPLKTRSRKPLWEKWNLVWSQIMYKYFTTSQCVILIILLTDMKSWVCW